VNPVEAVVPGASVYSVEAVVQLLVSGCEALLGGCAELEVDDTAPNHEFPFVRDGGGAPRGLTPVEHFAWAAGQKAQHKERFLSPDLIKAVRYEVRHTAEQIDSHRQEVVNLWRAKAAELDGERIVYENAADIRIKPLVEKLHVPFIQWLVERIGYPDKLLAHRCATGFPFAGEFDRCWVDVQEARPKKPGEATIWSLRHNRKHLNAMVLSKVKSMPHEEEVHRAAQDDAKEGYMSEPVELEQSHIRNGNLSRRLPVVEYKVTDDGGFKERIRTVDHETESEVNEAARAVDKLRHESVDDFAWVIEQLQGVQRNPKMWKRDLRKAFRGVPIQADHLDLAWVVWKCFGKIWVSQHRGMPFGTNSAVYGFHRLGAFIAAVVKQMAMAPVLRYVDDYFGSSVAGIYWTGGRLLDVLTGLVGRPVDPDKSADDRMEMVVLGAEIELEADQSGLSTAVQEAKALAWDKSLKVSLEENRLEAGQASKLAGRLSFAVTAAANKCGRAFIKPIHAQANCPYEIGGLSPWLAAALRWWRAYLKLRPRTTRRRNAVRKQWRMFTDASGENPHVAAVLDGGQVRKFTHAAPPDWLMCQFLERGDNNIGNLEAVAVVLGMATFADDLSRGDTLVYVDNQGVMFGFMNGVARAPETAAMVGEFWLKAAALEASIFFWRVETHANIADGPTRDSFTDVLKLGCVETQPVWPKFLRDLWAPLGGERAW